MSFEASLSGNDLKGELRYQGPVNIPTDLIANTNLVDN